MYGNNTNSKDRDNKYYSILNTSLISIVCKGKREKGFRVIKKPEKPQRLKECWLEKKSMEEEPENK